MDVRNAGFVGYLLLLLGMVGFVFAALSIAFSASRQTAAKIIGLVTLALAGLIAFGGALGTMYGRRVTESAITGLVSSELIAEKVRRAGYEEARSASKLALMFAVLPLVAGAIAALSSPKRKKEPSGPYDAPPAMPEPEGGAILAPIVLLGIDMMGIAGATLLLLAPLPGRDWAFEDPTWDLAEEVEAIMKSTAEGSARELVGSGMLSNDPCQRLDRLLDPRTTPPARSEDVPDTAAAASKCVSQRLGEVERMDAEDRRGALQKLEKSSLVASEEDKRRVEDALAALPKDEPSPDIAKMPEHPTVGGRLPAAVIQRILRSAASRFRKCYEKALANMPGLEGTVKVRFNIGTDGSVSSVRTSGSDIPDPSVPRCIADVVEKLAFPQPEGGIVTVTYPMRFTAK